MALTSRRAGLQTNEPAMQTAVRLPAGCMQFTSAYSMFCTIIFDLLDVFLLPTIALVRNPGFNPPHGDVDM